MGRIDSDGGNEPTGLLPPEMAMTSSRFTCELAASTAFQAQWGIAIPRVDDVFSHTGFVERM
jgi:hypothetical protein